MKKIFQIARYDFKRLMFNPITLVSLVVILAGVFLTGLLYKIPTTPAYSASFASNSTKKVWSDFYSYDTTADSKYKLEQYISQAQEYLDTQSDADFDLQELQQINSDCSNRHIKTEVEKYHVSHTSEYITSHDISDFTDIANRLHSFVETYDAKAAFESKMTITKSQFKILQGISNTFYSLANSGLSIETILTRLYTHIKMFDNLDNISKNVKDLSIHNDIISDLKAEYITAANGKLSLIEQEMLVIKDRAIDSQDNEEIGTIKSLITNYKKICESVKIGVLNELYSIVYALPNHSSLYGYEVENIQSLKQKLAEAKFYIDSDDLEYVDYQVPVNVGRGSSKITPYDHAYFIVSIVGFLNILFGIFCAYKLFGRDRKNGKLDLLLSQKVTFNEVFAAKFLAILFCTGFVLASFTILSFVWGSIFYKFMPTSVLAVFNVQTIYKISPLLFFLIKVCGIELQVIFWSIFTIFMMNTSRKFLLNFVISIGVFTLATIGNIFLNGQIWYCLLPFIHVDITSYLGGATMQTGFLVTSLYSYGNFFISLAYYLVVVALLYNFTKHLFKKT